MKNITRKQYLLLSSLSAILLLTLFYGIFFKNMLNEYKTEKKQYVNMKSAFKTTDELTAEYTELLAELEADESEISAASSGLLPLKNDYEIDYMVTELFKSNDFKINTLKFSKPSALYETTEEDDIATDSQFIRISEISVEAVGDYDRISGLISDVNSGNFFAFNSLHISGDGKSTVISADLILYMYDMVKYE